MCDNPNCKCVTPCENCSCEATKPFVGFDEMVDEAIATGQQTVSRTISVDEFANSKE